MASIVSVAATVIAPVYLLDAVVDVVPFVVKQMVARVMSVMVTDCAELYVPAAGEKTGVAAWRVYVAEAIALFV
jgi:hypothetical protein